MNNTLLRSASISSDAVERLIQRYGVPRVVARWLCLRDIPEEHVGAWLDPTQGDWTSPSVFRDMASAVSVLRNAIEHSERVCIVGDYDVDGVTSSTIVASTLEALGADWCCIIPHRVNDGYGLSTRLVERAISMGSQVILTVDNGIRALDAVQLAKEHGLRVIVTDHHEPGEVLPEGADAIIHWCRTDECVESHVAELSGAGVAWKLADAMLTDMGNERMNPSRVEALRGWHLGLATLGAIADIMPMKGENRNLVREGLTYLQSCPQPGWLALCEVANVKLEEVNDTRIAWSLTPRLNAAGRMGSAEVAFRLLMSADMTQAVDFAAQIETWNRERKRETDRAFEEACAQMDAHPEWGNRPMQVVAGEWPLGVVGIVAARLVDRCGVPAIVLADDGSDVLRGSGRAPEGFPLHETLLHCESWMAHFGGHESAIGCAIHRGQIDDFREAACEASARFSVRSHEEGEVADDYLSLVDANVDTLRWLQKFAPHGPQNASFTFYVGPVEVIQVTPMGNGKHVRVKVREGRETADLIWFQSPEAAIEWAPGTTIAAICRLEENVWRGTVRAQLRIESAHQLEQPLMRDDFGAVYRLLQARRKLTETDAAQIVKRHRHQEAAVIFDTFVELGFAQWQESAYHVVEQVVSRDLRDSKYYQAHLWKSACARY